MEYKDYEILARVWESTSDLYSLTTDGELDTSQDILLFNDDKEVERIMRERGLEL